MPHLEIRKKGRQRARLKEWPSDAESVTLGRSSGVDIVLHHTAVSRHHCTFERWGTHWRIRDHESRHGLKINGVRRTEAVLTEGDRIHIGPYELVFHSSMAGAKPADQDSPLDELSILAPDASGELALDDSSASSGDEIGDLREEFARIEAALTLAQNEAAAAKAELSSMKADGREAPDLQASRAAEEAAAQREARDERIDSMDEELRVARVENAQLREALAAATAALEVHGRSLPIAELADTRVQRELDLLTQEAASIRSELQAAQRERDELIDRLGAVQADLESRLAQADVSLGSANSERDRIQGEADELKEQLASLEASHASQVDAAASLLRARDDLAETLAERNRLLEAFRAQLEESLSSAEGLRSRLAAAEDARATLGVELARSEELLAAERFRREADADEFAARARDAAALQAQINEARGELDAATARHEAEIEGLRSEVTSELAALTTERDDLRERLVEVTEERDSALRVNADLQKTLAEERAAAPADSVTATALKERIATLEGALASSALSAQGSEQRLAVARQNLEQFRQVVAEAQKERDVWSTRARLAQAQVENLKKEVAETRQRIRAYEGLLVDYVTQLQAAGQMDAAVVEMSTDEILRAQRDGATVVELDYPRR